MPLDWDQVALWNRSCLCITRFPSFSRFSVSFIFPDVPCFHWLGRPPPCFLLSCWFCVVLVCFSPSPVFLARKRSAPKTCSCFPSLGGFRAIFCAILPPLPRSPGIVPGSARRARGGARSRARQMLHVVLSAVSLFKTFGFDQRVRRCGTAQTGVNASDVHTARPRLSVSHSPCEHTHTCPGHRRERD